MMEYSADEYMPPSTLVDDDDDECGIDDKDFEWEAKGLQGTGNFSLVDLGHRMQQMSQ
jgi:hypothetical protein